MDLHKTAHFLGPRIAVSPVLAGDSSCMLQDMSEVVMLEWDGYQINAPIEKWQRHVGH
jgi:hypothetical protein